MKMLRMLAAIGALCAFMGLVTVQAEAQTPAPTAPPETTGFDGYRALAVTAGVVVGAAVAVIVTDGLIIPVVAWVSGHGGAGAGMGTGMAMAGDGAAAGGAGAGYGLLRGVMRVFGAISGALYADALYTGR